MKLKRTIKAGSQEDEMFFSPKILDTESKAMVQSGKGIGVTLWEGVGPICGTSAKKIEPKLDPGEMQWQGWTPLLVDHATGAAAGDVLSAQSK